MIRDDGRATAPDSPVYEAFERLAQALHKKMEHLEPSNLAKEWEDLSLREKEFYFSLLEDLLARKELIHIVLEASDNGIILWSS
jgi:hypothetical protein